MTTIFDAFIQKNLEHKHIKYKNMYKSNEVFWGLGIENEMYLEFEKSKKVNTLFMLNNHKKERYSVDYFASYKKEIFNTCIIQYLSKNPTNSFNIPFLLNSHSFTRTDKYNNPKLLYRKNPTENPAFQKTTWLEDILEEKDYELAKTYTVNWLFDGDVIEITTNNFYKNDLDSVINELEENKRSFINALNEHKERNGIYKDFGKIDFMRENYPFSIYLTNENNISMFNNGTLHYNITLPTKLNKNCKIEDYDEFKRIHKEAIKIVQWFEPFLVPIYNSPDPFSYDINSDCDKLLFSKASQRCAMSRYIGIGTYDTDGMKSGKLLQMPREELSKNLWYNKFHDNSAYNKLESVGLDINFNKHYNHGFEIRFFDHIKDTGLLKESLEFIIYLMDIVLSENYSISNPIIQDSWNNFMERAMRHGKDLVMTREEKQMYLDLLKLGYYSKIDVNITLSEFYYDIFYYLMNMFNVVVGDKIDSIGNFSKLVLRKKNEETDISKMQGSSKNFEKSVQIKIEEDGEKETENIKLLNENKREKNEDVNIGVDEKGLFDCIKSLVKYFKINNNNKT